MQKNRFSLYCLLSGVVLLLSLSACKHDPVFSTQIDPPDTPTGGACDPDVVYFQNEILPILISNCTQSGCHNAQDHEDGVVLTSYETLMSTVERVTQNDWRENKLIRVLEDSDPDDRMPLDKPPLSAAEINLLKKWVSQGAVNNACDENFGACDTVSTVSYATFVSPLIQSKCKGCHSGTNPQGGIKLTTYSEVKTQALNGKLYGSVSKASNWMPKGGAKLDACTQAKLRIWVENGALEN